MHTVFVSAHYLDACVRGFYDPSVSPQVLVGVLGDSKKNQSHITWPMEDPYLEPNVVYWNSS